jgi:hypothetical protein
MITRRDFIKGMGALALCVSMPMAAGATVTPSIGYYKSLQYAADSVDWEALNAHIADVLNASNPIFDMTGTMTIPQDGETTRIRYTVHPDRTDAEIVGE